MSNVVQLQQSKVERWAKRINDAYRGSVEAIVHTGRELNAAKEDCDHGEWGAITGETTGVPLLAFKASTAQRFMSISNHAWLSNPAHGQDLPASWRTLYELTKLTPADCSRFLADGRINPDMTRLEAEALVKCAKPKPRPTAKAPTAPPPLPFPHPSAHPTAPPLPAANTSDPPTAGRSLFQFGAIEGRPDLGIVCRFGADELKKALAAEGSTPADVGWDGTEVGMDWEPPPIDVPEPIGQPAEFWLNGAPVQIAARLIRLCGAEKAMSIAKKIAEILNQP